MKKALLIVNPVAGKKKLEGKLDKITEVFKSHGFEVSTEITQYRGHGTELARGAQTNGFDLAVCCGGDGTLNEAISGILAESDSSDFPLGYIPAGSTNDFANTLGLPEDPVEAAERICEGNLTALDIGDFGELDHFSYIATFGAFSAASYDAPQALKNKIGHLAYILQGPKQLANMPKYHVSIDADGRMLEGDYIYCSVSNTRSVAGIVKLKSNIVDLHDGLFEVILVKYPKNITDVWKILKGLLRSDFSSDAFEFFKAKDIIFRTKDGVAWSLDGEKAEPPAEVRIRNLPASVKMYL